MQNTQPTVSVVVPVYNSGKQILLLLDRLRYQSYPKEHIEVVIIDDGSTDDTKTIINSHYSEYTIITVKNAGSYSARNVGIAISKGNIIAFTDADCIPHEDWIQNGIKVLLREKVDIVAGSVCMCLSNEKSATQMYDKYFGINQQFFVKHCNFGATANLFATRTIVQRVGGFDPSVRSGGDVKFCKMALASGGKLIYSNTSIVDHPARKTLKENLKKVIRVYTGLAQIALPWSFLRFIPLSSYHKEYFDYNEFLSVSSPLFRTKFRVVYYSMHLVSLLAYSWASLKRSFSRFL